MMWFGFTDTYMRVLTKDMLVEYIQYGFSFAPLFAPMDLRAASCTLSIIFCGL